MLLVKSDYFSLQVLSLLLWLNLACSVKDMGGIGWEEVCIKILTYTLCNLTLAFCWL